MQARLASITIDCSDANTTGSFFRDFLGLPEAYTSDDRSSVCLQADGFLLNFVTVPGYTPPAWPEPGQQMHLDFEVADLDAGVTRARELGARMAESQPDPTAWRVMIDPSGHPFCLMQPTLGT